MTEANHNIKHLAVIMDGNRRWAKERGLLPHEGHQMAFEKFPQVVEAVFSRGIPYLTAFAFSIENWQRSAEEVGFLMRLFEKMLTEQIDQFIERGVRLRIVGLRDRLSDTLRKAIVHAEETTRHATKGTLSLCINYGGRAEIVAATKAIVAANIAPEELTEELFSEYLWMKDIPDPDMIIRTSGEKRSSGFLLWEAAYAEWFYVDTYWPDFGASDIDRVIEEYKERHRRFGR